jgi:hypothetical protein
VTRNEQTTERALAQAEADWLLARGWRLTSRGQGSMYTGARYAHADLKGPADLCQRDALALTRAEPLRFRCR